jgi:hypothetical protein
MAWIAANRYFHWAHRIIRTENDCFKIGREIIPQLGLIRSSLNTLGGSFNNLVVYLKARDAKMDSSLFISKSPIQLTGLGERVLNVLGGKGFIDKNLHRLLEGLKDYQIKTALDAQIFAPMVISGFFMDESFNEIKSYVYEHPYYREKNGDGKDISVALDMVTVSHLMGICLRDKYLEYCRPEKLLPLSLK